MTDSHTVDMLRELYAHHDAERERLWNSGDKVTALRHARWADALLVAANNLPFVVCPADWKKLNPTG